MSDSPSAPEQGIPSQKIEEQKGKDAPKSATRALGRVGYMLERLDALAKKGDKKQEETQAAGAKVGTSIDDELAKLYAAQGKEYPGKPQPVETSASVAPAKGPELTIDEQIAQIRANLGMPEKGPDTAVANPPATLASRDEKILGDLGVEDELAALKKKLGKT
jgi:hypothetical protein